MFELSSILKYSKLLYLQKTQSPGWQYGGGQRIAEKKEIDNIYIIQTTWCFDIFEYLVMYLVTISLFRWAKIIVLMTFDQSTSYTDNCPDNVFHKVTIGFIAFYFNHKLSYIYV